jgi:hypothetical protein
MTHPYDSSEKATGRVDATNARAFLVAENHFFGTIERQEVLSSYHSWMNYYQDFFREFPGLTLLDRSYIVLCNDTF